MWLAFSVQLIMTETMGVLCKGSQPLMLSSVGILVQIFTETLWS